MTDWASRTIGSRLSARGGIGPGFDLMRVLLALAVLVWHSIVATGGINIESGAGLWLLSYAVMVVFFALGGFLCIASAERLSVPNFAINRALRILPALGAEVILSVFIIGVAFTTLPLADYFAHPETWAYFGNVFGWVHYTLPGVFETHPDPATNNALWTVPFEFAGYSFVIVLVFVGAVRRPGVVLAFYALLVGGGLLYELAGPHLPGPVAFVTGKLLAGRGSRLLAGILLGIAAYQLRDRLPYSRRLAFLCAAVVLGASTLEAVHSLPLLNLFIAPPLVYLTAFAGVSMAPRIPLLDRGDYSYGIYLYGFPVEQCVVALWPTLPSAPVVLGVSLPVVMVLAMASWHGIEKPVLRLRKRYSLMAKTRLERGMAGTDIRLPVPRVRDA